MSAIPDLPVARVPRESWVTRPLTEISTAVDAAMARAMAIVVNRALIPREEDFKALRASLQHVLDPELFDDPQQVFTFVKEPVQPLAAQARPHRRLRGGRVIRRKFTTEYEPYGFEPGATASHDPILMEHWVHDDQPPRATMITLHGFTMGRPRIDSVAMFAQQWFRAGLDVALLTLPYHGARTPAGARFSGDRFAVPNVAKLGEAVREAIYEIHTVSRWLAEHSGAPVGVLGLSLGGYLSALMAGLSDDLDFAIPMVPPVCFGNLAWRFFTQSHHHKDGGSAALTEDELRAVFRFHSPLAHSLKVPKERVLIIAGRGDRIVPPDHPYALWEHWQRPAIHWFSGSHLAPFGRGRIVEVILEHLRSLGI